MAERRAIILLILGLIFGGDITGGGTGANPFDPGQVQAGGDTSTTDFSQCKTGADANRDDTCRIIGTVNSVQAYWRDALPADVKRQYQDAKTVIYSGSTQSACGVGLERDRPVLLPVGPADLHRRELLRRAHEPVRRR